MSKVIVKNETKLSDGGAMAYVSSVLMNCADVQKIDRIGWRHGVAVTHSCYESSRMVSMYFYRTKTALVCSVYAAASLTEA